MNELYLICSSHKSSTSIASQLLIDHWCNDLHITFAPVGLLKAGVQVLCCQKLVDPWLMDYLSSKGQPLDDSTSRLLLLLWSDWDRLDASFSFMFKIYKCVKFPASLLHELQCCAGGWLNNLYLHFYAFAVQHSAGVSILWRLSIRHVEFVRWGSRDCSLLPHNTTCQRTLLPNNMMLWRLIAYVLSPLYARVPVVFFFAILHLDNHPNISLYIIILYYIHLYTHIHHTCQCIFTWTDHEVRNKPTWGQCQAPLWSNASYCTGSSSTMARCYWRSNVADNGKYGFCKHGIWGCVAHVRVPSLTQSLKSSAAYMISIYT